MANPNILNASSVTGNVAFAAPSTTSATTLLSNAASSGVVIKLESLVVSNVTAVTASATVSINSAAAGGGTPYRIAFQIPVPAYSSLQVIDKNSFQYLPENSSVVVTSTTASALEFVGSYETIY